MTSTRIRPHLRPGTVPGDLDDSPLERENLRKRVSAALDGFLDRQDARLVAVAAEAGELVLALRELLSGGKRLRPAFAYWAWRGAGGPDDDRMVTAAAALELFQASAIVHDDVMDHSDTRRGRPAVHRRFAGVHRDAGWRSDGAQFGAGAAILVGDLCLGWSDEMFFGSGLAAERLVRARSLFEEMRTELMGGQYLDLLEQALGGGSVARARRVIEYKSARYSVLRPLQLGAALAGASPALRAAYDGYGLPLGEAFQLRDDVLGVFGDPAETGKPAGDDLREGKRTVLVALAVQHGSAAQVAVVDRHLGDPALDLAGVEALREVLVDTGALDAVERMIATGAERALDALAAVEVAAPADGVLRELAAAATARRF
ncbi:MAG TPA: polyprenyl synthetase family protein [Mycobacteriales bacterium]|nr:polyprenyl synthetase family protein [Mycobacteriales bacterium]